MRKFYVLLSIMAIVALFAPASAAYAKDNGVDDLRGRWDVELFGKNLPPSVILYINDIQENPYSPDMYLAGGCMRSPGSDAFMPLSLAAVADPENGTYDVTIYSTVVEPEGWAYVIRLEGLVTVNGKGVPDDEAGGTVTTEFTTTDEWIGVHHDRRRTKCPSLQINDFFQAELYTHRDIATDPPRETLIYDTETVIVSSAMLVEDPYGNVTRVEYYTDLFSPDVDFIGRFRFTGDAGFPVVPGLPYTFTLLDALGRPIEGAVSTDTWNRCNQGAPTNFNATPATGFINLAWDAVPIIPVEFYPGDYQITMYPMDEQAGEYGAGSIQADYHDMPLNHFDPPAAGNPDGWDFGQGLLELGNGPYEINVWAWNQADEANGGWGSDCAVRDSSQSIIMHKQGEQFGFEFTSLISGNVSDAAGPLYNVHVDACALDDSFCMGNETDQFGNYLISGLPAGEYRVFVWGDQGGWMDEYYFETPFHHEATPVLVVEGTVTPDINFTMEPGGSISGNVSEAGVSLEGVHVDACAWDDSFCYGADTDSDGNYTIFGLPAGDYRVVVWGGQGGWFDEFYQEKQFHHEADPVTVVAGSDTGGVNFTLEIYIEPSPQYLNVQPDHMWADSGGWAEGAEVTLSFGTFSTSEFASVEGNVWFNLNSTGIAPGVDVHITDGVDSKDLLVVSASFDGTDEVENTAWGTAPADSWLGVAVVDENGYENMYWADGFQADEFGNWFVDFDDFDQDFTAAIDAWVHVFDDDGDSTLAHLDIPTYTIVAHPDHEWVSSHGWTIGDVITLYIDENTDPLDGYLFTATQVAAENPDDPGVGYVDFSGWPIDLAPSIFVIVTDSVVTEILLLEYFSIDAFDEAADTVSGTAPPNREVEVGVHQPGGDFLLAVMSDPDGYWVADFGAEGVDMLDVFDIHAMIWDEDGDATQANYDFSSP